MGLGVQVLSTGNPEVCNYPFTTRSIKMGHFFVDGHMHQVRCSARCCALWCPAASMGTKHGHLFCKSCVFALHPTLVAASVIMISCYRVNILTSNPGIFALSLDLSFVVGTCCWVVGGTDFPIPKP